MFGLVRLVLAGLVGLVLVGTLLAELPSDQWWIVGWDYARLQLILIALPAGLLALPVFGRGARLPVALVALCTVTNITRVQPYNLAFWVDHWERPGAPAPDLQVTTLNVKMDNPAHAQVAAMLAASDADVVLLLEVDHRWLAALEPSLARWPHQIRVPRIDFYGLVLVSRLPFEDHAVELYGLDQRPAVWADVRTPHGPVRVWGLHPEPPHPGVDADPKDAYLAMAAHRIATSPHPDVVLGDLNDVAWSATTSHLLAHTGLVDPRRGRGLFATFDARSHWMRWPIDHVFHDPILQCDRVTVEASVGSDHFPVSAAFRLPGRAVAAQGVNAQRTPAVGYR